MRGIWVAVGVSVVMLAAAGPAIAREHPFDIGPKVVDWGTITPDGYSGTVSDAIAITNTSDEPVALDLAITLRKPSDWAAGFDPFIVEDAGVPPNWEPCAVLAAGATCLVYVTFQTDRPGTFAGFLWINGTDRVRLYAVAVA